MKSDEKILSDFIAREYGVYSYNQSRELKEAVRGTLAFQSYILGKRCEELSEALWEARWALLGRIALLFIFLFFVWSGLYWALNPDLSFSELRADVVWFLTERR